MLAGLRKVKNIERSEHTAISPAVPSPVPTFSRRLETNPSFEDFCSAKETHFLYCKHLVFDIFVFQTY